MSHSDVRYPSLPEGEGLRAALALLEHLKDVTNLDEKCVVKDCWVCLTAIFAKVWPGEPDEDLVIGMAAPPIEDADDVRVVLEQIVNQDAANRNVVMSVAGLDWSSLIQLILPIILKLLERLLDRDKA